jgi:hypothetical protein
VAEISYKDPAKFLADAAGSGLWPSRMPASRSQPRGFRALRADSIPARVARLERNFAGLSTQRNRGKASIPPNCLFYLSIAIYEAGRSR